jgi:hypothetical protein
LKFIADALRVFTEDGEVYAEAIPQPTRGWDTAVTGTCRVAVSSDAPDKPFPVQIDCTGEAVIKSNVVDGKTEYWCECT